MTEFLFFTAVIPSLDDTAAEQLDRVPELTHTELQAMWSVLDQEDFSMPYLNGIEAAIKLRASGSKARIVFLTVNEDADFVRAALRT